MDFQRFSAKTVGDAVTAACQHFLVTSDKLEYEILEEGIASKSWLFQFHKGTIRTNNLSRLISSGNISIP